MDITGTLKRNMFFWQSQITDHPLRSPICGRIGDKRCLNLLHYLDCPVHPGSFHSKHSDCIKCVEAERREARQKARERNKENDDPIASAKAAKKANKKANKAKARPLHEKSIKQIRKEQRKLRQSASSSAASSAENSIIDDEEN